MLQSHCCLGRLLATPGRATGALRWAADVEQSQTRMASERSAGSPDAPRVHRKLLPCFCCPSQVVQRPVQACWGSLWHSQHSSLLLPSCRLQDSEVRPLDVNFHASATQPTFSDMPSLSYSKDGMRKRCAMHDALADEQHTASTGCVGDN